MVDAGRLKTDLLALAVLAAAVFLGLSLASFDPADPPAHAVFPTHPLPVNLCGEIGARASLMNSSHISDTGPTSCCSPWPCSICGSSRANAWRTRTYC